MTKELEQNDMRVRNASSEDRSNRAMEDRAVTHNRELSDEERIEMFRSQYFQHVLPDVPKIPGYHTCWLSTTSQNDTIIRREMLGYEPIRREDIPGWNFDAVSIKTGDHAGLIGINEMVAFKIKDSLYQAYMREAHFDAPNRQDEKLVNDIAALAEQAKANKTYIQSHDGHDEIESGLRRPSNPVFT